MTGLYIFLGVLVAMVAWIFFTRNRKATPKPPMVPVEPPKPPETYVYWGEAYPSQANLKDAFESATKTRQYYTAYPLNNNVTLYDQYPSSPTAGRGKYIGLYGKDGKIFACAVSNNGNIYNFKELLN